MPDQNQSDPNQPVNQPVAPPVQSTVPPIISPQADLPPLPPEFSTIGGSASGGQNVSQPTDQPPAGGSAAPPDISSVISKPKKKFAGGKIIATILGLFLLVGGIGAGIILIQQQQLLPQKAREASECSGCSCGCNYDSSGNFSGCKPCATTTTTTVSGGTGINTTTTNNGTTTTVSGGTGINTTTTNNGTTTTVSGGTGINTTTSESSSCTQAVGQPCKTSGTPCCKTGTCDPSTLTCTGESGCTQAVGQPCKTSGTPCCKTGTCDPSTLTCTGGTTSGTACIPAPGCATAGCSGSSCSTGGVQGSSTCFVSHYWCLTRSPGGCSSNLIEKGTSASFSKDCGTEQIDLYCEPCCMTSVKTGTYVSKTYNSDCAGTPGPGAPMCVAVKAYDASWNLLTSAQLSALTPGVGINFCVNGSAPSGTFDKAQFTIKGVQQPETTAQRPISTDFCQSYTIQASDTTVTVTAKIHHSTLGWY
jgi:hypothetical protein